MAGFETRMLLLGAVSLFEPVNGYQIRRELISWEIDKWAHVNPGSIYHGLRTLTEKGHLVRHDLQDGKRKVAVYEATDQGRAQLREMLATSLETVDPYDRVAFHAAFGLLPLLDREQVLHSLERRRDALEEALTGFPDTDDPADNPRFGPPHAFRGVLLWRDSAATELGWLLDTIDDIRSGELRFQSGEDWQWVPPEDDPGWQMHHDRERYRGLLGRR